MEDSEATMEVSEETTAEDSEEGMETTVVDLEMIEEEIMAVDSVDPVEMVDSVETMDFVVEICDGGDGGGSRTKLVAALLFSFTDFVLFLL